MTKDKLFEINENNGIPIWLQVKNGLLHMIMSGHFQPGDQLPTVRHLAVVLSINYNTVNKVYMELEREGFIISRRGKGTFVTGVNNINKNITESLTEHYADEFITKAFEAGLTPNDIISLVSKRVYRYGAEEEEE